MLQSEAVFVEQSHTELDFVSGRWFESCHRLL